MGGPRSSHIVAFAGGTPCSENCLSTLLLRSVYRSLIPGCRAVSASYRDVRYTPERAHPRWFPQYLLERVPFHPVVEVILNDTDASVPRRGLGQRPLEVNPHTVMWETHIFVLQRCRASSRTGNSCRADMPNMRVASYGHPYTSRAARSRDVVTGRRAHASSVDTVGTIPPPNTLPSRRGPQF